MVTFSVAVAVKNNVTSIEIEKSKTIKTNTLKLDKGQVRVRSGCCSHCSPQTGPAGLCTVPLCH